MKGNLFLGYQFGAFSKPLLQWESYNALCVYCCAPCRCQQYKNNIEGCTEKFLW